MPTTSFANVYELRPNISADFDLKPNLPDTFTNPLFWTVSAECTGTTPDSSVRLFAEVLRKHGKVNGRDMNEGQSDYFTVTNGSKLTIIADGYAQVRITNKAAHTLHISCHTL